MTPRRRRLSPWVLVFLVVVVNLPAVHSSYLKWQLHRSGVETTAALVDTAEIAGKLGIEFRYDIDVDPEQNDPTYVSRVDRRTFDTVVREGRVQVRVLPDRPATYEVHGQVTTRLGLLLTGLADLMLLSMAALYATTRRGRRRDREQEAPPLHLVAVEDVQRCRPGAGLEALDEQTYLVTGEVSVIDDVGIVLDVAGRAVRIDLAGHANPVGYQQPGRVRARLSDLSA